MSSLRDVVRRNEEELAYSINREYWVVVIGVSLMLLAVSIGYIILNDN